MNSVEAVKAICKERRIPLARIEKDLGFGNGYISQLKRGKFPGDRLYKIADYLDVDPHSLNIGEIKENKKPATIKGDGLDAELLRRLMMLTPDEILKVDAFVQGLLASR